MQRTRFMPVVLHLAALLALGLAVQPARAGDAAMPAGEPYAVIKAIRCTSCTEERMPVPRPRRGIVVSTGALFSGSLTWTIVDLDDHRIERVSLRVDRGSGKWGEPTIVSHPLSETLERGIIEPANRVWSAQRPMPSRFVNHPFWSLALFDVDDQRKEGGAGLPDGAAGDLDAAIEHAWQSFGR